MAEVRKLNFGSRGLADFRATQPIAGAVGSFREQKRGKSGMHGRVSGAAVRKAPGARFFGCAPSRPRDRRHGGRTRKRGSSAHARAGVARGSRETPQSAMVTFRPCFLKRSRAAFSASGS